MKRTDPRERERRTAWRPALVEAMREYAEERDRKPDLHEQPWDYDDEGPAEIEPEEEQQ